LSRSSSSRVCGTRFTRLNKRSCESHHCRIVTSRPRCKLCRALGHLGRDCSSRCLPCQPSLHLAKACPNRRIWKVKLNQRPIDSLHRRVASSTSGYLSRKGITNQPKFIWVRKDRLTNLAVGNQGPFRLRLFLLLPPRSLPRPPPPPPLLSHLCLTHHHHFRLRHLHTRHPPNRSWYPTLLRLRLPPL
jgi:hypothetical protein